MTDAVAVDAIRLTLHGDRGAADLVVPRSSRVDHVAQAYADATGLAAQVALATTTGRALDGGQSVRHCGLADGDVILALSEPKAASGEPASADTPSSVVHGLTRRHRLVPGVLVVSLALAAAWSASGTQPELLRNLCGFLLLVAAFAAALPWRSVDLSRTARCVAPALSASAAFVVVDHSAPGGPLLAVALAGLAATSTAAVARALAPQDDETTRVWIAAASVITAVAVAALLLGAPQRALWSVVFAIGVLAARWLPYLAVDVPDQELLDLDRLAVTAWSARERPRARRRRIMVRPESVDTLAHRGHRVVSGGVVAGGVVMTGAAPLLASSPGSDTITRIGVYLLLLFGGAGVALMSRSYRSFLARVGLRVCGGWVLAFLGGACVLRAEGALAWALGAAAALVAVAVVVSAVAIGRGWRSIWWARTADIVEGACVVFVVAALPVASGLFGFVRQLTS